MAEVAALIAAKKIGSAALGSAQSLLKSYISKEVKLIAQLPSSMSRIQREFLVMHAFLKKIEVQEHDDSLQVWLHEVRKIAHEIEDIADKFVHLIGDKRLKGPFYFYKIFIKSFLALRYIASRLKVLESDLDHAISIKGRWVQMASESSALSLMEKEMGSKGKLLGMEENIEKLKNLLTREDRQDALISIWGPTGVGKSALVSEVYATMKKDKEFVRHALVPVKSGSNPEKLLKLIVKHVSGEEDNNLSATQHLQKILGDGKYLIILDGLEESENVDRILESFPRNNPGSRIVIVTQSKKVADLAQQDSQIELKTAIELFCRVLVGDEKSTLSEELEKLAKEMLSKCGNLPLAITCVANALSPFDKTNGKTAELWRNFNKQFPWHLENNKSLSPLKDAVNVSLKNLPGYLKSCFLFCSIFPMNYQFSRKRLIRFWVAEGFIEKRGTSTVEEVAEECLNELVARCMFQVDQRNSAGRIKRFKMHAAMQVLVSAKSKMESFSVLCEDPEDLKLYSEARHLSLTYSMEPGYTIDLPQLRSFMALESQITSQMKSKSQITPEFLSSLVSESRYLAVLHLEKSGIEDIPDKIGDLFNLRYLNLRHTRVAKLPKSIGKLTNLQTLDVIFTEITKLPPEISKLTKLRHFFAGKGSNDLVPQFHYFSGVTPPKAIGSVKDFQTLQGMNANEKLLLHLSRLSQLRSLLITKVKKVHCRNLISGLKKLHLLSALRIFASNENEQLNLTGIDDTLKRLRSFELHGQLTEEAGKSLIQGLAKNSKDLTYLYLGWTGLKENPLPLLGQLKDLATLILNNALTAEELQFSGESFPNLKWLVLYNMAEVKTVEFDGNATQKLEIVQLQHLRSLNNVPQGIMSLKYLDQLCVSNMPNEFKSRLNEFKSRCNPTWAITKLKENGAPAIQKESHIF